MMSQMEIHGMLVQPVCALEEYIRMDKSASPIVEVIAMQLRAILDTVEKDNIKGGLQNDNKNSKA